MGKVVSAIARLTVPAMMMAVSAIAFSTIPGVAAKVKVEGCVKIAGQTVCVGKGSKSKNNDPAVLIKGTAVLEVNSALDLDTGKSEPNSASTQAWSKTDIFFAENLSCPPRYLKSGLAAIEGAMISVGNNTAYDLADCESNVAKRCINLAATPGGTYFCVRTNQGNTSMIQLSTVPVIGGVGNLKVKYTTWRTN